MTEPWNSWGCRHFTREGQCLHLGLLQYVPNMNDLVIYSQEMRKDVISDILKIIKLSLPGLRNYESHQYLLFRKRSQIWISPPAKKILERIFFNTSRFQNPPPLIYFGLNGFLHIILFNQKKSFVRTLKLWKVNLKHS